MIHRHLFS